MGNHDLVDRIRIALRDGVTEPDEKAAADLIDRLTYDPNVEYGMESGMPWDIGDQEAYRALLHKDLDRVMGDLRRGEVEYEGVGWDEMPPETLHARRLHYGGVLEAAGLMAYRPASGWVPLEE